VRTLIDARLASGARHWRSLGGRCLAGNVDQGAIIAAAGSQMPQGRMSLNLRLCNSRRELLSSFFLASA
jgi:hypothetical protein